MQIFSRKIITKSAAIILCCGILFSGCGFSSFAQGNDSSVSFSSVNYQIAEDNTDYELPSAEATLLKTDDTKLIAITDDGSETYDNVLEINPQTAAADYEVIIEKSGWYNISVSYFLFSDERSDWTFSLLIDGKKPFENSENITLPRYWKDDNSLRKNGLGDEISPSQISADIIVTKRLYDKNDVSDVPYKVNLEAGTHSLKISNSSVKAAITDVTLLAPEYVPSYSEATYVYKEKGYKNYSGKTITVQGEESYLKNSKSLVSKADRSSARIYPASATNDVLNYIGGTSWQQIGDEIVWRVDVPQTGLYQLGFSYIQNTVINGVSYRHLKINGKTPFKEAEKLRFDYSTSWNYTDFCQSNGQPYLFALEKGVQTISLSVTLGDNLEVFNRLKEIISNLGDLYIDITIITGESPDVNRDYQLFKRIPDWENRLKTIKSQISQLTDIIRQNSGKRGSTIIAAADNVARTVDNMLKNPYTAQVYVKDYYNCYTTLSSWLFDIRKMPLGIDKIDFYASDSEKPESKIGFFNSLSFGIKRFLFSFTDDYSELSSNENDEKKQLKIWVNWGRDQAMVLNNLIEESFADYAEKELGYKVSVNLELVNASLVKGILSNNAPDLALHQVRSEPVNLAIRGAICDLSQFDGFDEVVKRFGDTAVLPYQYNGGTYALPDQQTFFLMFYRKDILSELGLSVPKTWDEFLAATAVLQRNNMNSYIPYIKIANENTVNTGIGSLNLFPTVLMQSSGNFYNDKLNVCLLDSPKSVEAFKYWSDMYTKYKLPTEADFYNRFRLGTSPLGISSYVLYNTLSQAAPEIDGRWGIALVPGIKDEDTGEINSAVSGGGTGCSVLSVSKNKEAAWVFLKWWTEANTQLEYNNNVEAIIGSTARVPLATKEAFEKLSWNQSDLPILREQFEKVQEINEVPGSYYVSRAVDQAFWNVVTNGKNVKDVLIEWNAVANDEITRKIDEYKK